MATVLSKQLVDGYRKYPIDAHGKFRILYFYYKNETGGTLADGTEIDLGDLPPGRVRILPKMCSYRATAMSTSRVLDIGHRAYASSVAQAAGTLQAEDDDAFVSNKDISGAVNDQAFDGGATGIKSDLYSLAGIRLYATVDGGTIPANAEVEGYVCYLTD